MGQTIHICACILVSRPQYAGYILYMDGPAASLLRPNLVGFYVRCVPASLANLSDTLMCFGRKLLKLVDRLLLAETS